MKPITDFIHNELNPALFEKIDEAFPTLHFVRTGKGGWRSALKMDGSAPSKPREDKTIISSRVPTRALEQGGGSKDLITLYKELNGLSTDIEAIKALASICGLTPPERGDSEAYKAYKEKQDRLEAAVRKMAQALYSDEGKGVLAYLQTGRGYEDEFIKYAEFGYCSPQMAMQLSSLLYKFPYGAGTTHTLAIPYRNGGRVVGIVFRALQDDVKPKYKDAFISATASKKYHLFGLTGLNLKEDRYRKDITIVEGEIDALRAQFAGLTNVVAVSGGDGSIPSEALAEAKRRGVTRVTLLYDNDGEAKRAETDKRIEKGIETIYSAGLYPLVAALHSPDGGKVDTDTYLQNNTGADLQKIVDDALSGARYLFQMIAQAAVERQGGEGEETRDKNLHEYERQTIELVNRWYIGKVDRQMIFKDFAFSTGGYITEEAIQEEADNIKAMADQREQKQKALATFSEAYNLANGDEPDGVDKALAYAQKEIESLRGISREVEFSRLLNLPSAEGIRASFKERPEGIGTNYAFGQGDKRERFMLQSGALTYICAPTSHGKSRMLENLALQLATDGSEGDVLYFSFEEDKEAVEMQLLNIYQGGNLSLNNMRTLASYYHHGAKKYFNGRHSNIGFSEFQMKEAEFLKILASGKLRVYSESYDSSALIDAIRYLYKSLPRVKAVFVDYIQLLHTRGAKAGRKDELADMCREFMALAKSTRLPIILAAQLNREAYSPTEMTAQNIAEASEIEHSANTIMVLWNSVNPPQPKSQYSYQSNGKRKLSEEAAKVEARGFQIGTGGKIYAKLVKNRGGERNIDAVFDFNGNTGQITQPDYNPFKPEDSSISPNGQATKEDGVSNTIPF